MGSIPQIQTRTHLERLSLMPQTTLVQHGDHADDDIRSFEFVWIGLGCSSCSFVVSNCSKFFWSCLGCFSCFQVVSVVLCVGSYHLGCSTSFDFCCFLGCSVCFRWSYEVLCCFVWFGLFHVEKAVGTCLGLIKVFSGCFRILCSVLKMVHVVFFTCSNYFTVSCVGSGPSFFKKGFQMWFKVVFRKLPLLKVGKLCLPQNVLCLNLLKFVRRCLERLRWFGSASACCGMLQFVCKRGRLQFVCLLGFAMFCAVQRDSECLAL